MAYSFMTQTNKNLNVLNKKKSMFAYLFLWESIIHLWYSLLSVINCKFAYLLYYLLKYLKIRAMRFYIGRIFH